MYGQRLTAEEAKERDVIDECVDMKDLMDTAIAFTRKHIGKCMCQPLKSQFLLEII